MDFIDIFRTYHPNVDKYTFSSAPVTFSRIDHILGHKSNLSKFKKIEIVQVSFQPQCYEIRYQLQEKTVRNTNTWRLNNT